uniref:5'-AMP-activated protein kinase subunit beta-1 n=1 Tax=Caligus clemensi TaxID=344056 RepID=C1C0W2_CALCM|nr:5-AMP-activated protein kinase subunit beta-2 [Caligus clemensi]
MGNSTSSNTEEKRRSRSGGVGLREMSLSSGQPLAIITPKQKTRNPHESNKSINKDQDEVDFPPTTRPRAGTDSHRRKSKRDSSACFSKALPTIFKYKGNAKEVFLSGTSTGWKKIPMISSSRDFTALAGLPEGDHEYRFQVDGKWVTDPHNTFITDAKGETRNVIRIRKEDFDAYHALDMDTKAVSKLKKRKKATSRSPSVYGQEVPSYLNQGPRSGPPILPPHLLQVLLNKDTPLSFEPTLLPEPNHVMINHLYALSIKDRVLVLSSTHRYRKKYVTTLLYTPLTTKDEQDEK